MVLKNHMELILQNSIAYKDIIKLAEFCNLPIVTAAGHGDAIPFNHKLHAGQMGPRGNPVASRLVKEANVILAIGTRLGFNSTFYSYENINKNAKIVHIELEKKMLGKYFPIKIGIHADAATATKQIYEQIKKNKIEIDVKNWTNLYLKERNKYLIDRDNNNLGKNFPIQPKGVFKKLRKALPKNSAITLDAGTLCLQATDALEYYDPPSLFTPLDFGLVEAGSTIDLNLTLGNNASTGFDLELTLDLPLSDITIGSQTNFTLSPGSNKTITVRYAPTQYTSTNTLEISHNSSIRSNPESVVLRGIKDISSELVSGNIEGWTLFKNKVGVRNGLCYPVLLFP